MRSKVNFEALALAYAQANGHGKNPLEVLELYQEAQEAYRKIEKEANSEEAKNWLKE